MRALIYEGNRCLVVKRAEKPDIVEGEALIRVHYAGICGTDILIWNDGLARVKPPVVLGHEFSGVIESIGSSKSPFKPGDRVVVEPLITCGTCKACTSGEYNVCTSLKLIGIDTDGGMAKYVKVPEDKLFRIPSTMSFEEAAFIEPLAVGVHMVKQSGVKPGQTALVVGGGPIGLITATVAQIEGAEVYISEVNRFRIDKAREFGFRVINPQEENIGEKLRSLTNGEGADVSFEATGTEYGLADCIEATCVKGTVVIAGLPKKPPVVDVYKIVAKELSVVGSRVYKSDDYEKAIHYIETRQFKPYDFISRILSLDEAIPNGFEAIQRGEPVIKILIRMENEAD